MPSCETGMEEGFVEVMELAVVFGKFAGEQGAVRVDQGGHGVDLNTVWSSGLFQACKHSADIHAFEFFGEQNALGRCVWLDFEWEPFVGDRKFLFELVDNTFADIAVRSDIVGVDAKLKVQGSLPLCGACIDFIVPDGAMITNDGTYIRRLSSVPAQATMREAIIPMGKKGGCAVKKEWAGALMVLISAFCFAMMPMFAKYAYQGGFDVFTVITVRFLLASLFFWGLIGIRKIEFRVTLKELLLLCIMGVAGYAVMASLFFSSLLYIPASVAGLMLYMYPILVSVLAYVFEREPFTINKVMGLVLSTIGLVLVLGGSFAGLNGIGVLMGIGAAVVYSGFITISNRVLKTVSSFISTTYVCTSAGLALLLYTSLNDGLQVLPSVEGWAAILAIAVFSTVVAILTFFKGIEYIGPSKASILSTVEPVMTMIMAAMLFAERLSGTQWTGALLIMSSLILLQLNVAKTQQAAKKLTS